MRMMVMHMTDHRVDRGTGRGDDSPPPAPQAGFISRGIAFVLDLVMMSATILLAVVLVQSVLGFFTLYGLLGQRIVQSSPFNALLVGVLALIGAGIAIGYPVGFWVLLGQTPGKLLLGLRIMRVNGRPISIRCALVRYAGYWLSALPLGLGFLWVLVDARRQGWHDKLAGTYVMYAPRPRPVIGREKQPALL